MSHNQYNNPPPYSEQPGFTPATTYQPGYQPPPPPTQSTVIIQTTTQSIGSGPSRVTCPSCRAEIVTSVKHEPNSRTHCWALILCLFMCVYFVIFIKQTNFKYHIK